MTNLQTPPAAPDLPVTGEAPADLRLVDCTRVLDYVTAGLGTELEPGTLRRKRRTVSGATTRGTWLRVEARTEQRVAVQGLGGVEAAATLAGIAKPEWYRSISWHDPGHGVWWRVDETELVDQHTVATCAYLGADPGLPASWWTSLRASLAALGAAASRRPAKLHAATASQDYLSTLAHRATNHLGAGQVDSTVDEWRTAHGDLTWANLTAPGCVLLDWEDWGSAPRGFDAATLLLCSLAVPALADRIRAEFADDLASRSGQVAVLALCADLLASPESAGPFLDSASAEAIAAASALHP